jgi:hypothetical protein
MYKLLGSNSCPFHGVLTHQDSNNLPDNKYSPRSPDRKRDHNMKDMMNLLLHYGFPIARVERRNMLDIDRINRLAAWISFENGAEAEKVAKTEIITRNRVCCLHLDDCDVRIGL